jgi:tight adherence protein B
MTLLLLALAWAAAVALLADWLLRPEAAPALPRPSLARMADWLHRAGVRDVAPWQFLGAWLGFAALSLVAAGAAGLAPAAYFRAKERRRQAALEEALVEAMRQLRDAVRSGLGLTEAFEGLARTGPPVLRPEFRLLGRQAAYAGFAPALAALRDRLASPLGDLMSTALLVNDRLGGRNLGAVLHRLARAAREQRRLRREAEAAQAGQVLAVTLAAAVPVVVFAAIHRANPAYLASFATPTGELLLGGAALLLAAAYAAMLHLGRLPAEPRVLRPEEGREDR